MAESLSDLLVKEGVAQAELVEQALARQKEAGGTLDSALLEIGSVNEGRLLECLSHAANLPAAPETAFQIDPRSRRVFPSKVAERHVLAPFALEGRELCLVSAYPVDTALLEEISFMLSLHLKPHVGLEWRVRELIQRLYGTPLSPRLAEIAARFGNPGSPLIESRPSEPVAESRPPEPVVESRSDAAPPLRGPPTPPAAPEQSFAFFEKDGSEPEPLVAALAQVLEASEAAELLSAPAAPPLPEPDLGPAPWSLSQARDAIAEAKTRDEVVRAALRYARVFFEYAALLAVTRKVVAGHDALGAPGARDRCRQVSLDVHGPAIVRTVVDTCGPHLGPISNDPGNSALLAGLGRQSPRTAFLYPVILRDRPVCVLYADNGEAPVSPRRLGDLLLLSGSLGAAFERIIRAQKEKGREPAPPSPPPDEAAHEQIGPTSSPDDAAEPAPPSPVPEKEPEPTAPDPAAEPWQTREPARIEQTPLPVAEPFDPAIAIERLLTTPPRSAERGDVISELVAHGSDAATALAACLPGPIESDEHAAGLTVLDLGPIYEALAAIGDAASPSLMPLLTDHDPERRRAAVLLLGHFGDPAAQTSVADRVFDPHPRVSSVARRVLAKLRKRPELRQVVEMLRRALLSEIPERSVGAARALGELHDVGAIPLLIQVLEASHVGRVTAAGQALAAITLERHGVSARRWLTWWKNSRGRPRAQWLIAGLRHPDREIRVAASEELRAASPPPIPYNPDAQEEERNRAADAWADFWTRSGFVI